MSAVNDIDFVVDGHVATIVLNRPANKNAFTMDMVSSWAEMLREARRRDDIRALVLTGSADTFCAGADLTTLSVDAPSAPTALDRKSALHDHVHEICFEMERLDKPTIAAVEGVAVGAGMDMALMCDMRVAGDSARFSEGYVRVGFVPGDGGCFYLPRIVGLPKALELLLTGDWIGADEAHRIGLVNRVVGAGESRQAAEALAAQIASSPPVLVRTIKRATYQSATTDLRTALDLISSHSGVIATMHDTTEAMAAFRERRPGHYEGH